AKGCLAIWRPAADATPEQGARLREYFGTRLWLGVSRALDGDEAAFMAHCPLAAILDIPPVACGGATMHCPQRKPLQDALTAIRIDTPVTALSRRLAANAERHLRPLARLRALYPPELLAETLAIARRCRFSLDELRYEYPDEVVRPGVN